MNKKLKYSIIVASLILLNNCIQSESNEVYIPEFSEPITLKGKQVFKKEVSLTHLQFLDSVIVLSTGQDTIFHVYSMEGRSIAQFGLKGKGPGEFMRAPNFGNNIQRDKSSHLVFYDDINDEVVSLDMHSSLSQNEVKVIDSFTLNESFILDIFLLDAKHFVGMYDDVYSKRIDGRRGLFQFDKTNSEFKTYHLKNINVYPRDISAQINVNTRSMTVSTKREKAVLALYHYPMIEVFDLGKSKYKKFYLSQNLPETPFDPSDFKNRRLAKYYIDIHSTNKFIYLLESAENPDNKTGSQLIKVLNWNLAPHKQYQLQDSVRLNRIVTDDEDKKIWGISYKNDKAYVFDM